MTKVYICWGSLLTGRVGRGNTPISQENAEEWIKEYEDARVHLMYWTEHVTSNEAEALSERQISTNNVYT